LCVCSIWFLGRFFKFWTELSCSSGQSFLSTQIKTGQHYKYSGQRQQSRHNHISFTSRHKIHQISNCINQVLKLHTSSSHTTQHTSIQPYITISLCVDAQSHPSRRRYPQPTPHRRASCHNPNSQTLTENFRRAAVSNSCVKHRYNAVNPENNFINCPILSHIIRYNGCAKHTNLSNLIKTRKLIAVLTKNRKLITYQVLNIFNQIIYSLHNILNTNLSNVSSEYPMSCSLLILKIHSMIKESCQFQYKPDI
jgi:hypothetical protein